MDEAQDPPPDQISPAPLMVETKRAATMLGVSERMLRTLDSSGRVPRPVRLGRRTLWRVAELEEWVAAGCPNRERWEADDDGVWHAMPGLGGNRPFPGKRSAE